MLVTPRYPQVEYNITEHAEYGTHSLHATTEMCNPSRGRKAVNMAEAIVMFTSLLLSRLTLTFPR